MNFRSRSAPQHPGIQLAPLVDVLSLLLIFSLMTWHAARHEMELDVNVRQPSAATEKSAPMGAEQPAASRQWRALFRWNRPLPPRSQQFCGPSLCLTKLKLSCPYLTTTPLARRPSRPPNASSITPTLSSVASSTTWPCPNTK